MFWRRRLPHWAPEDSPVFVTWRLAGTLPRGQPELLVRGPLDGKTFVLQDRELDHMASGPRWLREPPIAAIFRDALLYGENVRRYDLLAWVVMPNHVHLVLQSKARLPDVVRWLKTATAVRANRTLGRNGEPFWQREYFDRWIRSEEELLKTISYVENNPVTAGLAASPEEWPWSSPAEDTGGETAGATVPA